MIYILSFYLKDPKNLCEVWYTQYIPCYGYAAGFRSSTVFLLAMDSNLSSKPCVPQTPRTPQPQTNLQKADLTGHKGLVEGDYTKT